MIRFVVPSARTGDRYEVSVRRGVWTCTCPARVRCWHVTFAVAVLETGAVDVFPAFQQIPLKRPAPDLMRWLRARNRRERTALAAQGETR